MANIKENELPVADSISNSDYLRIVTSGGASERASAAVLEHFRGCDSSRMTNYGAVSSVTPTKDGWLRAVALTDSGQSIAPILDIAVGGESIGRGLGLTVQGTATVATGPVKAGVTYSITAYRATISDVKLFY